MSPPGVGAIPAPTLKSNAVRTRVEALSSPAAAAPVRTFPSAAALILGVWALGALVLLAAFGRSFLRLGQRLRSRPRIVGGTIHAQLRDLAAEAGLGGAVRLSCSSRVPVPVALGIRRPEICVPPRALAGLTEEQQQGMLAHELAHLARRDPFWLVLRQVIACAFFFQPLNWVARRRLREISEMLSDEWAVARTGRPLSLAGCLAEVAGWSVGTPALPVPGMADRPSSLGRRIRRLLDDTRSPENPARRAWLTAAMGVLVIAVAAAAPAVSPTRPEPPPAKAPATLAATGADAIDVNDATDSPTRLAAAEVERHEVRHRDHEKATAEDDDDEDDESYDTEEPRFDFEFDFNNSELEDLDELVDGSLQAALSGLDSQLETLAANHELTEEDQEKLSRDMDRKSREIERSLKPRLEKLSRELAEKTAHLQALSPEMQRLTEEMSRLGERMGPSKEEMDRLHAQIDEQVKAMRHDGKLTSEERERIRHQAREMAEKMKPTEEQRREMARLRAEMKKESSRMESGSGSRIGTRSRRSSGRSARKSSVRCGGYGTSCAAPWRSARRSSARSGRTGGIMTGRTTTVGITTAGTTPSRTTTTTEMTTTIPPAVDPGLAGSGSQGRGIPRPYFFRTLLSRATKASRWGPSVESGPWALKNQGPPGPSTTAP